MNSHKDMLSQVMTTNSSSAWTPHRLFAPLLLFLAGCASVPLAPPLDDSTAKHFQSSATQATIYIFRDEGFIGSARTFPVLLDGLPVGATAPKTFLMITVPPGRHRLKSTELKTTSMELETQVGGIYFVRHTPLVDSRGAWGVLELVPEDLGRKGVLECKLASAKTAVPAGAASGSAETTEQLDWKQFEPRKVAMSPEQALKCIRLSLVLMGRELEESLSAKGTFVIERIDLSGFACKMQMSQSQESFVVQTSIKLSAVNFGDVTRLGIRKSSQGLETGAVLLGDKGTIGQLPFSNATERDKLLSALALVCEHLKMN